uniref:Putative secreted protein n=1 Tax=Panstrongylus lignarius TaxID=156445 RepID=A0A224XUK2_9HEMI
MLRVLVLNGHCVILQSIFVLTSADKLRHLLAKISLNTRKFSDKFDVSLCLYFYEMKLIQMLLNEISCEA